jgi:hypothetical protein
MVQAGMIELTSVKKDKFVLGPNKYVGKKAIVGVAGKGEPTVSSIVGHQDGKVYSIDKADVDKVLGKNYFAREASRRQDSKKLVRRFLLCGRNSLNAFFCTHVIGLLLFLRRRCFPKIGWF